MGGLLSFFVGVGVQFAPIPEAWRWGITIAAGAGFLVALIGFFMTHKEQATAPVTGTVISISNVTAGRDVIQMVINQPAKSPDSISDVVLSSQIEELNQLQEFIVGSESRLWELFGIHGITHFNIRRAKLVINPNALTPDQVSEINAFFKDGQSNLDSRYCKVIRTAGGIRYEEIPGKLGILNLSAKYVASRQTLAKFESSPKLPFIVRTTVKELNKAALDNVLLLHEVINQKLAGNQDEILHDDDGSSPLFGATSGAFLERRIWLGPKQEAILSEIRQFLKIT